MRYRKKPVVIDAFQWTGDNAFSLGGWHQDMGGNLRDRAFRFVESERAVYIKTLEGEMRASPGDWIIRGIKGEFYPCKPDIFAATYEPVGEET